MGKSEQQRFHWLADQIDLNKYQVGAEVGCRSGATTGYILRNCPTLKLLYTVDVWGEIPVSKRTAYWRSVYGHMHPSRYRNWRVKFNKNIEPFKDQVMILQGLSWEMAKEVGDKTLDFVFIDADHAYESVVKDILAWSPKLGDGGLLCGHDINLVGVRQAVDKLLPNWSEAGVANVWYVNREDSEDE